MEVMPKDQDDMPQKPRIRLAIPKKGRLYNKINDILIGSGFHYTRHSRQDIAICGNFPLQLVFLPASDIATFVGQGDIEIGITGQDIVAENEEDVEEILELGFGKCKLCVLAPEKNNVKSSKELVKKRICTSFTAISRKYFRALDESGELKTPIKFVSGSVEATCSLGLADAVVDLVESGTTMRACGLEIIDVIMSSQAVLIGNKVLMKKHAELIECIKNRIKGCMTARQFKLVYYNIEHSKLDKAKEVSTGKRAPTVAPLGQDGWVSVSVMVENAQVGNVMDRLHKIGARDIFTVKLDNFR